MKDAMDIVVASLIVLFFLLILAAIESENNKLNCLAKAKDISSPLVAQAILDFCEQKYPKEGQAK